MRRGRMGTALVVVAALVGNACGGGGDDDSSAVPDTSDKLPDCPLDALDEADGPVEIVFWHGLQRELETTLQKLTDDFNSSQDQVQVKLVNNGQEDQQAKFVNGLATGDIPDAMEHQETHLQDMVDSRAILPAQSCLDAAERTPDAVDTDDFLQRALHYYAVGGVQWAMPFNVTNPVLLYNKVAFRQAGLDPDKPPTSLEEYRADAQAIKDAGFDHGIAMAIDAWHFEEFMALQGQEYVDHANGRDERATKVTFDSDTGEEFFTFLSGLVEDGLAVTNPREGPDSINNLLAIGQGTAGMTVVSSSALGTILQVVGSGQYPGTEMGIAPLPGRTGDGGAVVGGGGLYVTATDPAKQAAAWKFITFLTSPESQAVWSAGTGYVPVRTSAVDSPEVQQRWTEVPGFRTAYDQLVDGAENDATSGAVVGDISAVRAAVEAALTRMFLEGTSPEDALANAAADADEAIAAYNDRIG
ncbi:MAG TPA: ABC transporter substrate-binding protein [Acidimicrobiales bacterium]